MAQIRIFIVDDSVVFRKILIDIIHTIPNMRVAGVASNGQEALEKIPEVKPDFITMDLDMPVLDGLQTLSRLRAINPAYRVIMLSMYTYEGAKSTIQALELGAFDFIPKPADADSAENTRFLRGRLAQLFTGDLLSQCSLAPDEHTGMPFGEKPLSIRPCAVPRVVAIGVSTGGPIALANLLPALPEDFAVPLLIAQHMPRLFTKSLAESLNRKSTITVLEAENGTRIESGHAYIAPGGRQMKIENSVGGSATIVVTDDPPENFCKPSVDYLFRSVAQVYQAHALGVILTGMGCDGVLGLRLMKRQGALIIGQDRKSCTVYGMSREAKEAGLVDMELSLEEIAHALIVSVCT
jgi:two-component system, chemotaxis family, protein-glutamate methylesterase/glutaminase